MLPIEIPLTVSFNRNLITVSYSRNLVTVSCNMDLFTVYCNNNIFTEFYNRNLFTLRQINFNLGYFCFTRSHITTVFVHIFAISQSFITTSFFISLFAISRSSYYYWSLSLLALDDEIIIELDVLIKAMLNCLPRLSHMF